MLVADIGHEAGCTFAQQETAHGHVSNWFLQCCPALDGYGAAVRLFCEYCYLQVSYGKSCETAKEVKKGSLGVGWILDTAFGVFQPDVWAAASAPHS